MRLLELKRPNIIVVYGGGFQPFHEGHMSSYRQAKAAFPGSAVFVAASNVTSERPFQFKEKQFLAQQAGVLDPFVQVGTMSYVNDNGRKVTSTPLNPLEVLQHFNPDRDVLVIVRSERDPMKTTGTSYYQPWQGIESAEPFSKHAYIFVTKKHDFKICNKGVCSGSEVRKIYSDADDATKIKILQDLYPQSRQIEKIKKIFDKRLAVAEAVAEASLATMRAYFAGDEKAKDPTKLSQIRDYFDKHDKDGNIKTKSFNSVSSYQTWLKQNKLTPITRRVKEDAEDEAGEVEKQRNLIPFPKGTSLVSVSDVYDWYKLGQVISDLDDADPKWFGQGAPETIISFGSEEEEHKLMPLLKRLGLKIQDIDPKGIEEAVKAEDLFEYLRKIRRRWAIVSKREGRPLVYFKGEGKPSPEWVERQERRIRKHSKKR